MPTNYVTVKQSDPDFLDYLWGRPCGKLKNDQRAIPIRTYNLGTPEESVTFELQNITDIKIPGAFVFLSSFIKLKSFILILFPLFYVLSKNYVPEGYANPLGILLAAVSSILLFAGLNIRNDVYDHISGFDRVNDSNYKPIRMGWISAHKASQFSFVLIFISAVLALPVALMQLKLIGIIAIVLTLFFIGRFSKNNYKQRHLGEIILFLLIGPALVSGYQVALGAEIDTEIISFGALWGFAVLYLIQINNFSHIMTSSLSGIKNTMTKLGFDLSQKFLIMAWIFFIAIYFLFHLQYFRSTWAIAGTIAIALASVPLFMKISNIKSPMGSGLQLVRKEAHRAFVTMVFVFLLENFWYLWIVF